MSSVKEKWLSDFFRQSRRGLLRYLIPRVPNEIDAEDAAQEVYLRLLRVNDVGLIRDPRSFALRVASNVAYEWRMRAHNKPMHSDETLESQPSNAPSPFDEVQQAQEMSSLSRALTTLSPTCRAVVLLHRRDEMTYQEIAQFVGLSVGMVKKHLRHGLAVCRDSMLQEKGNGGRLP
jgi:RNA polymerase sigma factor (sigma-70 family)